MDAKEILKEIKVRLGMEEAPKVVETEKVEVALEQMKLEDGTVIEAEQFAPEFSVGIVNPEAEEIVPLPIGEYMLEDGRKLIVAVDGIIGNIESAEEPAMSAPVPAAPVDPNPVAPAPKKVVESVSKESFFSEVELKAIVELNETLTKRVEELEAQLKGEVTEVELKEVKPIKHNPENKVEPKVFNYHSNKRETTESRVFKTIANLK